MEKNRTISSNFGSLLRFYREGRNLSLKDVEELTGVSAGYVCRLEKGERKAPSLPILKLLASALQVNLSELIEVSNIIENEDVNSISKLLVISNFTVSGKVIEKGKKELLISIINKIIDVPFEKDTKMRDSFEIIELIEEFKNEFAG